jgi:hypothetical protein
MRRPEEILEIAEIVDDATEKLVAVLERSGAARPLPPQVLRDMAHAELELAAIDIACLTFGTRPRE